MKKIIAIRFTLSVFTVLFIAGIIGYYLKSSKNQFLTHSSYSLKTIAQEKANIIEAEINSAEGSIKLLSDFVSTQMTERELKNPNEVFSKYSNQLPFDIVEYIRWDGLNMMNSTGTEPFDASERPYYKEGIKGKSGIWPNFKPKVAKEVLLNFYTPLYYKGEISGVITGAIGETTSLKTKFISSYFGHQIQSFICDENFIVISSACEDIYPGLDLKKWTSYGVLNEFIEHANINDEEPFSYHYNNGNGLCCTSTIKSNGWHIAVIVYPKVLRAVEKETSGNIVTISIHIVIIMFLYLTLSLALQAESNKIVQHKLIESATRDELTGLYNRRAYEAELRNLTANPNLLSEDFNYVAFDVNGLKNINDSLGHEAGDELIKGAADCIGNSFEKYGKVYRTGGDEFIALITANDEEISQIKKNFAAITAMWKGNYNSELTIPAGFISKKEVPDATILELSKIADQRMYREKTLLYIANGVDRRAKNEAYEVLCESYTKILKINLTSDDFSIIQMDPTEKNQAKGYDEHISVWLHKFGTSGQVYKDDVEEYLNKTSIEYLRNHFNSGKNELCIQYRRVIGTGFCKVLMEIKAAKDYSDENQVCFLYVKNIDK